MTAGFLARRIAHRARVARIALGTIVAVGASGAATAQLPPTAAAPTTPSPRAAPQPPVTLQDLQDVLELGDLVWAPDGKGLAFTATPLLAGPSRTGSDVWWVEPGRGTRAITRDAEPDRTGDFNASGTHLSLSSRRGGDTTVQGWLWDRHDSALHPLAKVEGGLMGPPSWASDASELAAIARPHGTAGGAVGDAGTVVLLDPGGVGVRALSAAPLTAALAWSPRSKALATVARSERGRRALALVELDNEPPRVRWFPMPAQGALCAEPPVWSPDASTIAARVELAPGHYELRVWDVGSGEARVVSLPLTERFGPAVWAADGLRLLLPLRDGLRVHVAELRVQSAQVDEAVPDSAASAAPERPAFRNISEGLECAGGLERARRLAAARTGDRVAFVKATPRGPDEIFLLESGEPQARKLTAFHVPVLRKGLGSVEAAQLPTPVGPRPVLLTYPPASVAPRSPWPVLLMVDAGPGAPLTAGFDAASQLAAAAGYLVVRAEWPAVPLASADAMDAALAEFRRRGLASPAAARWAGPPARVQQLVHAARIPADSFAFPDAAAVDRRALERWLVWLRGAAGG